ncbi:hypothetical protein J6590_087559 [Homalodisca vitripennis]|nr:hypothetical protein J6590_087559 [Homalodisca vitripennis]
MEPKTFVGCFTLLFRTGPRDPETCHWACERYGHLAKTCNATRDTSGHCGKEGHSIRDCKDMNKPPICTNCKRAGKDHKHALTSNTCPSYLAECSRISIQTNYD